MKHNETKFFKLGGSSLKAAKSLYEAMHSPAQTLGGDDFMHEYQNEFKRIGQMSKSIQVMMQDGALPRAYARTPVCYAAPSGDYFLLVPVDYMGRHFVPKGAVLLTEEEIEKTGLRQGNRGGAEPLVEQRYAAHGTAMPADFNPQTHLCKRLSAPFNQARVFLLGLDRLKPHFCDGALVPWLKEDEVRLEHALTCDENRRPLMMMAAYRTDNDQAVPLRSNGWLRVQKTYDDFFILHPVVKTAGGHVLQESLDKIPDLPDTAALWRVRDIIDGMSGIKPPPLPLKLIRQNQAAPWPFPKSAPAP